MKPDDASEQTIFDAARQMPDAQARAAYLDAACAGDASLRERIERLLLASQRADEFLASHPFAPFTPSLSPSDGERETGRGVEGPGTVIGNYKLLEKLGEGGFGVVYMAEQKQPIKRRVALKIIKVGMDTREVVARFEAERQALALMDHPCIAKVFDAGATEAPAPRIGESENQRIGNSPSPRFADSPSHLPAGRPYFVMELVRGIKITDYCDEKKLSTRERLDLFTQVCQAVQHAHQKGIIHRDLKPSNILVTVNDGVAVPKIIDFGIAKATQLELTEKTVFTRLHQFLGTPAYMSPEQTELTSVDIDTRSDIYSLGVLLYELLTGKTPFDTAELLKAGLDEMRRVIREKEPERPSTRLTRELARQRISGKSEIRNPKSEIEQDLDWIVMKCLEKDRARRYETANGLATDIQRHLNNEPVVACPPRNLYKFQKLVRRNKLAFAAVGGVVAALMIGLAIALWQSVEKTRAYNRAVAAEKAAQAEATRSEQVAEFLKDMLAGAGPEVAKGRDATILLEILDKTAERVRKELSNQPAVESDLSVTIGDVYSDLGRFQKAEPILRRALAISNQSNPNGDHSKILRSLARALDRLGNLAEAEEVQRKAVALHRQFHGDDAYTAVLLADLAERLSYIGKKSEASRLAVEALALSKEFRLTEEASAHVLALVARVETNDKKYIDAETHLRQAIALRQKAGHELGVQISRHDLAAVLTKQGQWEEAITLQREVLAFYRRVLSNDHPSVAASLNDLASWLVEGGVVVDDEKLREAEKLFREAIEIHRKRANSSDPGFVQALNGLGAVVSRQRKADAEPILREAVELCRTNVDWPVNLQSLSYNSLGKVLADLGRLSEAEAVQSEFVAKMRKSAPDDSSALAELAVTLLAQQKFAQAEPIARECLELRRQRLPDEWSAFSAQVLLGESLLGLKRYSDAEPLLLAGYQGVKERKETAVRALYHRRQPGERKAIELLVQLYQDTGRDAQATEWKQKLAEFERAQGQPKADTP